MKRRILCFGDSITWGMDPATGDRLEHRWPVVLQDVLGPDYAVIEEGQGGRTIASDDPAEGEKNGLRYILPCLESHSPLDMVVIMLGINDCKRKFGYSGQDIAWEMQRFLDKVLAHDRFHAGGRYQVLVVSPPHITEGIRQSWLGDCFAWDEGMRKSKELAGWFKQIAEQYGCLFLDAAPFARASDIDGIHLDEANQIALGKAVADFIARQFS